jgi:hypothetical protein
VRSWKRPAIAAPVLPKARFRKRLGPRVNQRFLSMDITRRLDLRVHPLRTRFCEVTDARDKPAQDDQWMLQFLVTQQLRASSAERPCLSRSRLGEELVGALASRGEP